MLEILDYKTGENESKKLLHGIDKFDGKNGNKIFKNLKSDLSGIEIKRDNNIDFEDLE